MPFFPCCQLSEAAKEGEAAALVSGSSVSIFDVQALAGALVERQTKKSIMNFPMAARAYDFS